MLLADAPDSDIVAVFAIFFVFGLPTAGWIVMRLLAHRERMEMIRHGFDPGVLGKASYRAWQAQPQPQQQSQMGPAAKAKCGDSGYAYGYGYPSEAAQIALRKAAVVVGVGLALTIGLSFIGWQGDHITPGPWLLGGLVPLFVGLAQVFSAMAAGATFRPAGAQQYYEQPQPGAAPSGMPPGMPQPPGAQASSGPYTYRPGGTPELRPPYPPAPRDG